MLYLLLATYERATAFAFLNTALLHLFDTRGNRRSRISGDRILEIFEMIAKNTNLPA